MKAGGSWTPLLGRFMLVVTWENMLEHAAGAFSEPPLGVKGSWVRIPPSRQRKRPAQLAFFVDRDECADRVMTRDFARTTVRFVS